MEGSKLVDMNTHSLEGEEGGLSEWGAVVGVASFFVCFPAQRQICARGGGKSMKLMHQARGERH